MKASTLTLLMIVHMFTVDVRSSSGHWMLNANRFTESQRIIIIIITIQKTNDLEKHFNKKINDSKTAGRFDDFISSLSNE